MGKSEYTRIHIRLIPTEIISHYNLNDLVDKYEWVYMKSIRGMYGLPQAGILAKNLLTQCLSNYGYYQVNQTSGLWWHMWRLISFTLLVEYFEIGYVLHEHADHLMRILKMCYEKSQQIGKVNYTAV